MFFKPKQTQTSLSKLYWNSSFFSRLVVLYLLLFVNGQNVGVFVFLNKDLQSCHRMFMQIHQRSLESEKQLAIPLEYFILTALYFLLINLYCSLFIFANLFKNIITKIFLKIIVLLTYFLAFIFFIYLKDFNVWIAYCYLKINE